MHLTEAEAPPPSNSCTTLRTCCCLVAHHKVRAKLQSCKEGSIEFGQLQQLIATCSAADLLADAARIKKTKWSDLVRFVNILFQHCDELKGLPVIVMLGLTRRYAEMLLEAERRDDWAKAVMPAEASPDERWSFSSPALHTLAPEPDSVLTEEETASFREAIGGSFCNGFGMRMLANVTSKVPGSAEELMKLSHLVLTHKREYDLGMFDSSTRSYPVDILDSFCSMFRGFSALLCPIPGIFSSRSADVDFVMLGSQKGTLEKQLRLDGLAPPASKVMANHLRDSPEWTRLSNEYIKFAASEAMLAPQLAAHRDELLKAASAGAHSADRLAILGEFCNKYGGYIAALRPGACSDLCDLAVSCARAALDHITMEGSGTTAVGDRLRLVKSLRSTVGQTLGSRGVTRLDLYRTSNLGIVHTRPELRSAGFGPEEGFSRLGFGRYIPFSWRRFLAA